ncbi:MAG: hypothetical protein AB7O67_02750 [Vicinamibacterales bacterium]
MRYLVLAVSLLTVAACSSPTAPSVDLPATVTLAPGGTAIFQGTGLTVRFDRVVSDSRCPADAICIAAGDASVRVTLVTATGETTAEAWLADRSRSGVTRDGFLVTFEALEPYPLASVPTPADQYRATFTASRP